MLELRGVWKRYAGIPVVENVSFCARPGEVTGYLGPNGSGKSTTMKMIAGLIDTSFGTILFEGKPVQEDVIGYKRRMGYVPEEPYLYTHLTGLEYLTMVAQLRDLPGLLVGAEIDADESLVADAAPLAEAAPEIAAVVARLLERVRAGELARPPRPAGDDGARRSSI